MLTIIERIDTKQTIIQPQGFYMDLIYFDTVDFKVIDTRVTYS